MERCHVHGVLAGEQQGFHQAGMDQRHQKKREKKKKKRGRNQGRKHEDSGCSGQQNGFSYGKVWTVLPGEGCAGLRKACVSRETAIC